MLLCSVGDHCVVVLLMLWSVTCSVRMFVVQCGCVLLQWFSDVCSVV